MAKSWVVILLVLFSLTSVYAGDRFIIGTGDANNTVIDTTTGLMWERTLRNSSIGWSDAVSYCENLNGSDGRGGYEDWRMPSGTELFSLADSRYKVPAISNTAGTGKWSKGDPFYGVGVGELIGFGCWTNSPHSGYWRNTQAVDFVYGDVYGLDKVRSDLGKIWCVRGSMYSTNFSDDYYRIVGNLSGKEIVYVDKLIYVNNTTYSSNCSADKECPDCSSGGSACPNVDCPSVSEKTVYVNNCTTKNLSVVQTNNNGTNQQSFGNNSAAEISSSGFNWMTLVYIILGIIILGLVAWLGYYLGKKSNSVSSSQ